MTYEKINHFNLIFRKHQERNKDVKVGVTGERGDGKSNLIILLALYYVQQFGLFCQNCLYEWIFDGRAVGFDESGKARLIGRIWQPCPKCKSENVVKPKKFNFNKYMAYDSNELTDLYYSLPLYSPRLLDEAIEWAFSQDFAKTENKSIKKIFTKDRPHRFIDFMNMPEFINFDSKIRNMWTYWIRVMQRSDKNALAIILRKDKSEVPDKWHLKEFQEIMGHYTEDTPMEIVEDKCELLVRRHPCVIDFFYIPPLPEEIYKDYEAYRHMKTFKKETEVTDIDQRQVAKVCAYNLIERWNLFMGEIRKSRFDKPTVRMLEEYIFSNPKTNEKIVRYTTIRNWISEIARVLK